MTDQSHRPFSTPLSEEEENLSNDAIRWFSRIRAANLTEDEINAFNQWKNQTPAHTRAWHDICEFWDEHELRLALQRTAVSRHPYRLLRWHCWRHRFAVAAGAIVLFISWATLSQSDFLTLLQADHHTVQGEQRAIYLADGSTVTLNTKTAIATSQSPGERRTRLLMGEAFFKVQPDLRRPFLVDTQHAVTRAIGTSFLVADRSNTVEITVIEGSVDVIPRHAPDKPVWISEGEKVTVGSDGVEPSQYIDRSAVTAWMRGRLVFNAAPLWQVVDEVNRYHKGRIMVVPTSVRDLKVTGTYDLADTFGILSALSRTLPVHRVDITNLVVILY